MGTNYYAKTNYCDKCDRYDKVHIGKQSCGWSFLFSDKYAENFLKLKERLDSGDIIEDEYGQVISSYDFFRIVDSTKTSGVHYKPEDEGFITKHGYVDKDGYRFLTVEFS